MRPPHPFRPLFSVAATLLLGACARTTPPEFDATAESAKLLQRDAEWADAATAGKDVEKIISYWTDDAVVIEPGQPAVEGKQAIRAFVTASVKAPGFNIRWVSEKPIFSPSGGMAYMRAATENDRAGGQGRTDDSAPAGLFHLAEGRRWRVALCRGHCHGGANSPRAP